MGRRLAAILAADVVGYSKAMAEDEAGTLARLKAIVRVNEFFLFGTGEPRPFCALWGQDSFVCKLLNVAQLRILAEVTVF